MKNQHNARFENAQFFQLIFFFFESRVIFYQFKPFIHTTLYELALTKV